MVCPMVKSNVAPLHGCHGSLENNAAEFGVKRHQIVWIRLFWQP